MTAARAITCPSCGGTIGIKAAGYTVSVACLYCGTVLDVANDDVRIIAEYHQAVARLDIPLGQRGVLQGVEWEAIGWLERSGAGAVWQEYLLFNPYAGYRWLVHSEGEWQFGTMLTERPVMVAQEVAQWRGRDYELDDQPYQIGTRRVLGEFYWRVRSGDVVEAASFEGSDASLSCEWNEAETQWTRLVPLSGRQVRAAFDPPRGGRPRDDAPQGFFARMWARWADLPFDGNGDLVSMFGVGLVAVLAALVLMAALGGMGAGMTGQMTLTVDGGATHGEYGPLSISRASQMVTVKLAAQEFTNKWIDVDLALVNRQTHQAITAATTIQHYSGTDSDGAWSEGSREAAIHVADVPRGDYNLTIEAKSHTLRGDNSPANVADALAPQERLALGFLAERGGMDWALFWTVAGLILIFPTCIVIYRLSKGRLS